MTDAAALNLNRESFAPPPRPPRLMSRRIERQIVAIGERIRRGALALELPNGRRYRFGAGRPEAELKIRDWGALTALAARGDIGWGEAYVAGLWDSPDIEALAALVILNGAAFDAALQPSLPHRLLFRATDRMVRRNSRAGSARNIRAHYDVGDDFYRLWLDDTMTYSSALFDGPQTSLEAAQTRKYQRLLDVTAHGGGRTLEIGCGWGGFAEAAAADGRDVTAITISRAQHGFARDRLGAKADVRLCDYRDIGGRFDSIVSIEMIEAVGERYWPRYFDVLKQRLAAGGKAAIQAIVVNDADFGAYRARSDFIRHYTFPGGMLLSPERIRTSAANAGLTASDMFHFGGDYARTLREWSASFEAARPRIRALGYDDAFIRGWRYYLSICAATFALGRTDVVHVELAHA